MLLTFLGYAIVITFMTLIMTKKMTAFSSLIITPLVFGFIGGFGPNLGNFSLKGIKDVTPTAVMLLFAIIFFGTMINAGLFDPLVNLIIKIVRGDPVKILVGTSILSAVVSLDGDGSTTTMITCSALLPVYKKLKIKPLYLATIIILQNSIMNLLPWGGPTARIMSSLHLEGGEILRPLIPGMLLAIIYVIVVSYHLGIKERKRLGVQELDTETLNQMAASVSGENLEYKRPKMIWVNLIITVLVIGALVQGDIPSSVIFEVGAALALIINYPSLRTQRKVVGNQAGNAIQVVIMVLAAGIFMGVLTESGMSTAIANSLINIIPKSWGSHWAFITGLISVPGAFFLSNDAFYFGVLPILAKAGNAYGFTNLQIGAAATMGQAFHLLSPLVAFIYLLIQLTGVDMGEWQRHSAKWAIGTFVIFTVCLVGTGVIPL